MKKNLLRTILTAAILFISAGCDQNKDKVKDSDAELDVSITEASFTCGGGTVNFTVFCNTDWEITGTGNGFTVVNDTGEADKEVQVGIIAEVNLENTERTGVLKVSAGDKIKEIAIRQDAAGEANIIFPESSNIPFREYLPQREDLLDLIKRVTVKGSISADDLNVIADLRNVEYVDLRETTIDQVPQGAFSREWSKLTEIILPERLSNIDERAFAECSYLKKVVFSEVLQHIGQSAFTSCTALTELEIPKSVVDIGEGAFAECSSLKKINLPDGLLHVATRTFEKCSALEEITIPDEVVIINDYAFAECSSLKKVALGKNVANLGAYVFSACKAMTEFSFPETIVAIPERIFSDCTNLHTVTMSDYVNYIGKGAFANCSSLSSVNMPTALEIVEEYAFTSCTALSSADLPNGVTSIGQHAFSKCDGLTSFTIPASVNSLGDYAFYECGQLEKIYCHVAHPLSIGEYTFQGIKDGCTLYVPAASMDEYDQDLDWRMFKYIKPL